MLKKKPEDLKVAAYPELAVAKKDLTDLVLKKDRITSPNKNDADIKKKMRQYSKNRKICCCYTNIELNLNNENGCINTLRILDQAQRDASRRNVSE